MGRKSNWVTGIDLTVMPDSFNRASIRHHCHARKLLSGISLPIIVMPDSCYRASILRSFRMDPRLQLAGMTGVEIEGMTEGVRV